MTDDKKKQKEDFEKMRDAANKADMSSSKALQDDALTDIDGEDHDDLDKLKK